MTVLPHLAARLFGVPLAIHRPKLDVILSVLGARIGLADLAAPVGYTPTARAPTPVSGKVAVIPIHGTLVRRTSGLEAESGLASYAGIAAQLDAALASPEVAAILLDIDSPGGESGGVFDLADRIRAASQLKPVWAVANDMAFSAAYALASAATRVFVARTGGVGSIGVIAMHVDQSAKDAKDGVRYTAVFAGERKNDLNPHEPISDAAHAVLKAEVDRVYELFVETVARHRGLDAGAVRATEAGLFFGPNAVATGLADAVGGFDDALAQLTQSLSPLPTLVTPASQAGLRAAGPSQGKRAPSGGSEPQAQLGGHFRNHPMESSMNERSDPTALDRPLADPAGSPPQPSAGTTLSVLEAIEIAQTCTLAGRADLIAGFLETNTAPAQVRSRLLAAQAEASPEIVSRIAPDAARPAASNPLIDAAKQLAAQSTKKEI
ncbi:MULTISPECIES: S49 family peptidase [Burkholderiaceae]|jgi:signal peptide peptidase SppA|uniref:Serine peptidase n=3 Tax=Burkholderiaceae TaxID=119060 RepID=A0A5E4UQB2_9BURK|nr:MULTISPECIES: S49 family peptidase [Burkholderiaceae]ALD91886.1 Periplasmic serine proteases (ClpP class) [Cupriavidus gilardii CR3]KAA6131011.1 S49 family peptidase [Cupriavidus cauae]KWW33627.1 putative signal peptide peptidase SppA [Cupriavidus metallidurans]MCO8317486.1 S49 family peptidase [Burkholderia multivorans]MCO8425722.1 S49 family peptidase [Burkholderia multivorans]